MINATQVRKGMIIKLEDDLYQVLETSHITPGKGQALMQTKLRRLHGQTLHDIRFRSKERVEQVFLETMEMQYLYQEGSEHVFMNTDLRPDETHGRGAGQRH